MKQSIYQQMNSAVSIPIVKKFEKCFPQLQKQ